jgi:hypothetical protein
MILLLNNSPNIFMTASTIIWLMYVFVSGFVAHVRLYIIRPFGFRFQQVHMDRHLRYWIYGMLLHERLDGRGDKVKDPCALADLVQLYNHCEWNTQHNIMHTCGHGI